MEKERCLSGNDRDLTKALQLHTSSQHTEKSVTLHSTLRMTAERMVDMEKLFHPERQMLKSALIKPRQRPQEQGLRQCLQGGQFKKAFSRGEGQDYLSNQLFQL